MPPRSSTAPASPKRAAVQAAVLRATEQLLAEGATYADLNIERIATRAGISRTAFYFYFADKRELLMRLSEDVTDELFTEADIWYSGSGDPEAEIREALVNIARLYEQHGPLLRAIVEVSTYDEEVSVFWRQLLGRFVDASRARISAEQEAGKSSGCDPAATAFALCWMAERVLYQELVQDAPIPREDLVESLVCIWMRTIYDR
ncbi:MAG TPA: TetR/AcrR family transcriptional regulator [Solirubrobacteraceae bacterium]|nr:TetR/AcrR family transcriptional regulator [Solirubrobacteraceae bacterium]